MIYLKKFKLLNEETEEEIILWERQTCYNTLYPLRMFPDKKIQDITLSDINIFYGGNGSGKSTILNIIASTLNAERNQNISKGHYFNKYINKCNYTFSKEPSLIKIITSDDVFDYLFDIRNINNNIDKNRQEIFQEYLNTKYENDYNTSDYDKIKRINEVRKETMSSYTRKKLRNNNIIEQSNGESALMFFEKEIKENALYILDEPENSLSAESQLKLVDFIIESVRFFNCQFIISTHSPFLLSIKDALIYDLDEIPVKTKKWTELQNVQVYQQFFKEHEKEFKE